MKLTINKTAGFLIWILYSNILIYTSFYYNWKQQLNQHDKIIVAIIIMIVIITIIWLHINKKTDATATLKLIKSRPRIYPLTIVIGLIVNFFYFGKIFLYERTGYWMTMEMIPYFLLLFIPVYIYILLSFSILDIFKQISFFKEENISDKVQTLSYSSHFIILLFLQLVILSFYFYGLNPGNMSYDTYNQVSQLKGIIPFNTWHPIGHTLFIGLLLNMWDNYAVITIFQILFFALVTSGFYIYLLKKKVKWQLIYLTAAVMSMIPSTGINVVTQWKDIPFTVGLLWGTLILLKMCLEKNYFTSILHAVEFVFCLLSISLFRFNGILAFILMLLFALIYATKSHEKIQIRNYGISALIILAVVFLINNTIPNRLEAVPNPPGMKLRPIYQGLAAMYVNGAEEDINSESRKLVESVATPKQMKDFYNPYFADTISSNTPKFLSNLSKISTKDALKMYIEAANAHPEVILGDKFNLATTMWSVTKDPFSYNNAYTTIIQKEMIEEFGVHRVDNKITSLIEKCALYTFHENYLLNTLVWRTGFFLALEFILFLYLIIRKDKKLSLFIPIICNAVIVFLTMPAQDYRYLWFISLIFPFIVIASLVKSPEDEQLNN